MLKLVKYEFKKLWNKVPILAILLKMCIRDSVMEGRLPNKEDECFVDAEYLKKSGRKVGDKITFYSGTDEEISLSLIHI